MKSVMILGRQTAIGLSELESLYGAGNIRPVGSYAALVEAKVDFNRIGGSSKAAEVLDIIDSIEWRDIQKHLEYTVPERLKKLGEGKFSLGVSAYGFDITPQKIIATGLNLKKVIRLTGRSTRFVPNNEPALNSAQVLHNKLTSPLGWELLLIKDGRKTILARTTHEQDIEAYALRDHGRPMRDARVGMLPPKLAQIIINLATGKLSSYEHEPYILDPFCGTGVILQEALLNGYFAIGSDIESRMIEHTEKNMEWLYKNFQIPGTLLDLNVADATSCLWESPQDVIASETYLGRTFTSLPTPEMLEKNRRDCDTIIGKFLKNVASQTKPGFRLGLALPAWHAGTQVYRLPLLDSLGDLGYNRLEFEHAAWQDLIYHRDRQIVGRELVVLTRK